MNVIVWNNAIANPYGSQGTSGIQNGVRKREVTNDDILDTILACCLRLEILINNVGAITLTNQELIKNVLACCKAQDDKFNALFSAILDLRRELLRGNRDIRR